MRAQRRLQIHTMPQAPKDIDSNERGLVDEEERGEEEDDRRMEITDKVRNRPMHTPLVPINIGGNVKPELENRHAASLALCEAVDIRTPTRTPTKMAAIERSSL